MMTTKHKLSKTIIALIVTASTICSGCSYTSHISTTNKATTDTSSTTVTQPTTETNAATAYVESIDTITSPITIISSTETEATSDTTSPPINNDTSIDTNNNTTTDTIIDTSVDTTSSAVTTGAPETEEVRTSRENSNGRVITEKLDINTESMFFFSNQKGKTLDGSSAGSRNPVLFNFTKKELSEGYVDVEHRAGEANSMPIETEFYGLTGKVKNNKTISIKAFNNTGKTVKITESYVEHASTLYHNTKYYKNTIRLDKYTDIDITKLCSYNIKPTTYRFVARFSTGETIYLYFFLNVNEPWLYSITPETWTKDDFDRMQNHRNILLKQIAADKIVPSEQLGVIGTMYLPLNKGEDDTTIKKWVKLAKSLVTDDMSNELKLYTAMKWISNNMSYDEWSVGKGARRAQFKDYSGKQDAFVTKTGRCLELNNILTIFCRTYGIPAIIINSDSHTWSAIYINNKWVEFDMVEAVKTITPKEDVSIKEINKGYQSDTNRITPFVLSRSKYDMKYDDIYKINYDLVDGTFFY